MPRRSAIAAGAILFARVRERVVRRPRGRTLRMEEADGQVGSTPSGGYDQYGRLLARHIGRHLPGNPAVIVANRPGAGGMLAYNHIYNTAPRDGSEIGISAPGNVIDRLLTGDKSNARYEPEKFTWLGVMAKEIAVFIVAGGKGISLQSSSTASRSSLAWSAPAAIPASTAGR